MWSNLVNNETVPSTALPFSLKPLMFETFVCTMAFSALAAPIARVIGIDAWQIGMAMTIAGVAWVVMAFEIGERANIKTPL